MTWTINDVFELFFLTYGPIVFSAFAAGISFFILRMFNVPTISTQCFVFAVLILGGAIVFASVQMLALAVLALMTGSILKVLGI